VDQVTIARWNIARYKRLIAIETDEVVKEMAQRLIAEEQAILAKNVRDTALAQVD
jgi:gamma-glutamyl phosphate reductase